MGLQKVWHILTRKKVYDATSINETSLKRCLKTWDLTALGVGSTLGIGVYLLVGNVAKNLAGPSVILSFFLAAIVSVFAGFCYAEFGARVPRAGSAYIYSYVSVGEFVSFVIGWNLILEYVIGSASIARGLSQYVDAMFNNTMATAFRDVAPINVSVLSPHFDFFAFVIPLILGAALAFGMRESSIVNNLFTCINVLIILFIIFAGSITADTHNWFIPATDIPAEYNAGAGGFFPFGFAGTLQGAATCFYGFVGFDAISTTGEEVENPRRAIPIAIILSLIIAFLAYFGVSTVITMMVPFYMQDICAPVANAFSHVGWEWARWVVSVGAIFGLCASMFGAMFPLPRVIYAMAKDGLIFRAFGHVQERLKSPVVATLTATVFIALMGALLELEHLIAMMSIGTLLAYTLMAACVLVLRYEHSTQVTEYNLDQLQESSYLVGTGQQVTLGAFCKQLVGQLSRTPTPLSFGIVIGSIIVFCCSSLLIGLSVIHLGDHAIIPAVCFAVVGALMVLVIALQPSSPQALTFQVPLVPIIPCISMFANLYLMLMLDVLTWIRFGIWMLIGIPIYLICLCLHERVSVTQQKPHLHQNLNGVINGLDIYKLEKNNPVSRVLAASQKDITLNMTIARQDNNLEMRQINPDDDDYIGLESDLLKKGHIDTNKMEEDIKQDNMEKNTEEIQNDQKEEMEKQSNIIKYLDQVIENEENALKAYSHPNYPENTVSTQEISHPDPSPESKESCNNVVDNETELDVSSKCNVVALIHREDHLRSSDGNLLIRKHQNSEETGEEEKTTAEDNCKFRADSFTTEDGTEIENINSCVNLEMETENEKFDKNDSNVEINSTIQPLKSKGESEYFIPNPPPMNEALLLNNHSLGTLRRANTIAVIPRKPLENEDSTNDETEKEYFIPEPPPYNLDLLSNNSSLSNFKRANTISALPTKLLEVTSDDSRIVELEESGQKTFLSKLNNILQNQVGESSNVRPLRAGVSGDTPKIENTLPTEPKNLLTDLHKELRVKTKLIAASKNTSPENAMIKTMDDENSKEHDKDISEPMSRNELKLKLELLFAGGNSQMMKPRLRLSSNPPTPEPESLEEVSKKLQEVTKSDTLKLQKERFSSVLDSFKIALNKDSGDQDMAGRQNDQSAY